MAKLIERNRELIDDDCELGWFGYFEGTPTPAEIDKLQREIHFQDYNRKFKDTDTLVDGVEMPTEVSKRAGLERWLLITFEIPCDKLPEW